MVPLVILLLLAGLLTQFSSPVALVQGQSLSSRPDLLALYSLRGSLGLRARDWPRGSDPCSNWTGVNCQSGRVVGLDISGLRRTRRGRNNPQFAVDGLQNLTQLASFNASGFLLPGSIPDWFGSRLPPGFLFLDLRGSGVVGQIPNSLGNLSSLTLLDVSVNQLTGTVPVSLGNLKMLNSLNLSHNTLSGSIPDAFWSLSNLKLLDLSGNNLTGKLPNLSPSTGSSGSIVNLSNNSYYGGIPASFAAFFSNLSSADLSSNYFDGDITILNDNKNVSVSINCLRNRTDQRSPSECVMFYSARGLPYDGPTALSPAAAPAQQSPDPTKKNNRKLKYILIGAIGGGVLLFLLAALVTVLCCKICGASRRTEQQQTQPRQSPTSQEPSSGAHITSGRGIVTSGRAHPSATVVPKINYAAVGDSFAYDQLLHATSDFSDENLIKQGHSGDLYQGQLQDGTRVVVKRIGAQVDRRDAYIAAEMELFAKGAHQRLVPFLGHCLDGQDDRFLVYRFLPNGDLATVLHRKLHKEEEGEEEVQSIDWIKRLKIATGVAEALCYLHNECNPPIVHRDLQASSILLDDKFEVRLGSLSENCIQEPENHQNVLTRLIRFSSASTDPGTSRSQPITCAYDVYCLGLVLLELVTGQPAAATSDWLDRILPCINIYEKDLITKIVDPSLIVDEDLLEEVWAMAVVAKSCLNPKPTKRPPTRHILKALENPLKVVRDDPNSGSGRLRATSSRGSWNATLWGSWRRSSSDVGMTAATSREEVRRSETVWSGSGGSNGGERSFSHRRTSKEIVPEPSGLREVVFED
ncbi:Leucine-rich repeat protein kinase family protein [Rhynchospora pubera]|uniref:Leucine-rich repeat protein kinase family protein n=1 Tax=Rhynchospora pubera TaxID=906938 RepID=A0AAV8HK45_9POAL|nr:Leucine-rich repeat protein kinase family protein [Rhynchospora pubera]